MKIIRIIKILIASVNLLFALFLGYILLQQVIFNISEITYIPAGGYKLRYSYINIVNLSNIILVLCALSFFAFAVVYLIFSIKNKEKSIKSVFIIITWLLLNLILLNIIPPLSYATALYLFVIKVLKLKHFNLLCINYSISAFIIISELIYEVMRGKKIK